MRVLINSLSVGSLSGEHVLFGHLAQQAAWTVAEHEFVVLYYPGQPGVRRDLGPNVIWMAAPRRAAHWAYRSVWEAWVLPSLAARLEAGLIFSPAGTIIPRCPIPQVILAQNPWCLVPSVPQGWPQRIKARLQRRAYRYAAPRAALLIYNSRHMRDLYRRNAGGAVERDSQIVYQAIDDETHAAAAELRTRIFKQPNLILAVSAMAAWKGIETLVRAIGLLHGRGLAPRLRLVGPWPDAAYRARIEAEIARCNLGPNVQITGQVSKAELHRHYAEAKVFCLMSRCESFGIPAVEAQAFGTPVVGSDCGAMPEVCGAGGVFGPADDAATTADLLERLLSDDNYWKVLSEAALENSARYRWSKCSRPLLRMFAAASNRRGLRTEQSVAG